MSEDFFKSVVLPLVALASSLIATFVALQVKNAMETIRREIAELENKLLERISRTFVTTNECKLINLNQDTRTQVMVEEIRDNRKEIESIRNRRPR